MTKTDEKETQKPNLATDFGRVWGAHRQPALLELVQTLSWLAVLLTALGVGAAGVMSQSSLWMVLLRIGVSAVGLGLVLWLFNWFLARGALEAARQQLAEAVEREQAEATGEWEA